MKVEPNLLTETKQIIKQQIDLHSLFSTCVQSSVRADCKQVRRKNSEITLITLIFGDQEQHCEHKFRDSALFP